LELVKKTIWDDIGWLSYDYVASQCLNQVNNQVRKQVRNQVWDQVSEQVFVQVYWEIVDQLNETS